MAGQNSPKNISFAFTNPQGVARMLAEAQQPRGGIVSPANARLISREEQARCPDTSVQDLMEALRRGDPRHRLTTQAVIDAVTAGAGAVMKAGQCNLVVLDQTLAATRAVAEAVSVEQGDMDLKAAVQSIIRSNLAGAAAQAERYGDCDVAVIVTSCPDVRYEADTATAFQEALSVAADRDVVTIPLGAFGGGADVDQVEALARRLEAEGKEVVVFLMPHKKDDDKDGCGAVGAATSNAALPAGLTQVVHSAIRGDGGTASHVASLFSEFAAAGRPTLVAVMGHESRAFAVDHTQSTAHPIARDIAALFAAKSEALAAVEKAVAHTEAHGHALPNQHARFALVDIGQSLARFGGAAKLMGGDRTEWQDCFTVSSVKTDAASIRKAIFGQLYPCIAQPHHDFEGLQGLVVFCPQAQQEIARQAIEDARANLEAFVAEHAARGEAAHGEAPAFYQNIVFVDPERIARALDRSADAAAPAQAAA